MASTTLRIATVALAVAAVAALVSCTINPATGERQLSLISEAQEVEMGRRAVPEVLAAFGEYPDEDWQRYVDRLGQELAAVSERPDLPWGFHVLDDPLVNAFAYPGGQIYVTRGILAHFGSEAELASVLGHEIGHVTARHSVVQMSQQQLAQLGLGVAAIASEDFRPYAGLAAAGLQVLFLKFSRDDERQSDDLGLRYMTRAGYDPGEMPDVFRTLGRIGEAAGGGRMPAWQSTHPDPANRVERIEAQIAQLPPEQLGGTVERDAYLRRLEGMTFGTDPRHGYSIGSTFYHPDMAFRMDFPAGWRIVNQRQAAGAVSPNEDAVVVLTVAEAASPAEAARSFFQAEGIEPGRSWGENFREFQAQTSQGGVVRGSVGFVSRGGVVLQLLAYTGDASWSGYADALRRSLSSFRELRDRRYLDVEPARIEVVTLPDAMTFAEFTRRFPSTVDADKVAILNGVDQGARLEGGRLMKRVVGGAVPEK
jgi:predicted Zn-dependent protease